jgi:hypothetical protein
VPSFPQSLCKLLSTIFEILVDYCRSDRNQKHDWTIGRVLGSITEAHAESSLKAEKKNCSFIALRPDRRYECASCVLPVMIQCHVLDGVPLASGRRPMNAC